MISEELSDEDLIVLINAGSKSAELAFYERYSRYSATVAKDLVKDYSLVDSQVDDVTTIIFSRIPFLIRAYTNVTTSFNRYWKVAARNLVLDYIRKLPSNCFKGRKDDVCFNLEDVPYIENDQLTFHDVLGEDDEYLLGKDGKINELLNIVKNSRRLTDEEKKVAIMFFFDELDVNEIAKALKISVQHVRYVIRTSKRKLAIILKDSYF